VAFKVFFQVLLLLSLFSCGLEDLNLEPSRSDEEELIFIETDSQNQAKVLKESQEIYSGSPRCSLRQDCRQLCGVLFLSLSARKKCFGLKSRQVYQIQNLYEFILTEDLKELKKINPFDLKVFFSLSSGIFFDFLKTVKPNSIKSFLSWIAEDWKVASVFQQEDSRFLYMQLFLNGLNVSPIRSLKESLKEDKTFVQMAWIKQNDPALMWLNDYLKNIYCELETEKQNCMLGAYCMLYETWEPDILMEIQESSLLASLKGDSGTFPQACNSLRAGSHPFKMRSLIYETV